MWKRIKDDSSRRCKGFTKANELFTDFRDAKAIFQYLKVTVIDLKSDQKDEDNQE